MVEALETRLTVAPLYLESSTSLCFGVGGSSRADFERMTRFLFTAEKEKMIS